MVLMPWDRIVDRDCIQGLAERGVAVCIVDLSEGWGKRGLGSQMVPEQRVWAWLRLSKRNMNGFLT